MKFFEKFAVIIGALTLAGSILWTVFSSYNDITNKQAEQFSTISAMNKSIERIDKNVNNLQNEFTQYLANKNRDYGSRY